MFTFFIILSLNLALHTIELDLPNEHLPFYFANYPKAAEKCAKSPNCQFKPFLENRNNVCWGYEPFCSISKPDNRVRYSKPECIFDNNIQGWAHNLSEQVFKHVFLSFSSILSPRSYLENACCSRY